MRKTVNGSIFAASLLVALPMGLAEEPEEKAIKVNHLKIAASMLGSAQSWTDQRIAGQYRLQNRTGSNAWRVIDGTGKVEITGSREACDARLTRRLKGDAAKPLNGEIVVLVHGLFQTRAKMESIETRLKQGGKRQVINFGYASTKNEIEGHAAALREVLRGAAPEAKISFVGHSMGCIVIRALLADLGESKWKLGRVVMIGPPNQGAEMARRFSASPAVCRLLGPGFEQLAVSDDKPLVAFPAPTCEFAVISGECPKWMLNNPLIKGEDDWIVGVSETRLEGAKCQACVPSHHGEIVHDPKVLDMIERFLNSGELLRTDDQSEEK